MSKSKVSVITKISILLEGEIIEMNPVEVKCWFDEAFSFVDEYERYNLGVRLRDAKQRWENQLEKAKLKSQINYESEKLSKNYPGG